MLPELKTMEIKVEDAIAWINFNRPDKSNAFNGLMWQEMRQAMEWVDATKDIRVGIMAGNGKNFTAGIDFGLLMQIQAEVTALGEGQKQERLCRIILDLQDTVTAIEKCRKPILAAIHGACIGGGVDIISACDMRYAAEKTRFSVKEVDLAIVADLGTLQRLPYLVGEGIARELALTGREFDAREAKSMGLVNAVFPDQQTLYDKVKEIAGQIASKSPLAVRGIKETMNYSKDRSVKDGLSYIATRNAGLLMSKDLEEAVVAAMEKRQPVFKD